MMKYDIAIKYSQDSKLDFQNDLKKRVQEYFKKEKINRQANGHMWFRIAFFFTLYWFCWSQLAFTNQTPLLTAFFMAGLILAFKGMAYNAVHDSCHQAITGNKRIDDIIYWISLSMLGPDPYLWKKRHNVDHHHYVNIPGLDSQIEGAKMFRFSPHQAWKPYHQYQHIYASFIYGIVTLHWIFIRDFVDLFSSSFKEAHTKKEMIFHTVRMVVSKAIYLGVMVFIPSMFLSYGLGTIFLAFVVFHLILSLLVTITFAVSHVNRELCFINPDENGKIPHSYFEHQLMTSMDYHATNPLINFIFGGMSAHVGHHMFPTISSVHLTKITSIIDQTASDYGMKYHSASYLHLIISHYSLLREMGKSEFHGFSYFHPPQPHGFSNPLFR